MKGWMKMKKYRKRPLVIEAMRWNGSNFAEFLAWSGLEHAEQELGSWNLIIPTLEGNMIASEGDYIIKGIKGEFYPCKPDIFEATYEEVED